MFFYYLGIIVFLLLLLILLNLLIIEKSFLDNSHEDSSSYECGFEHNSLSRVPFSLRYFLLTIVFLVFDMEVILLVFLPFSVNISSVVLLFFVLLFLILLVLGLLFEWFDGSLDWII